MQLQELVKNNALLKYFNEHIFKAKDMQIGQHNLQQPAEACSFKIAQCRMYESILMMTIENNKLKIGIKFFIDRLGRYPDIPSVLKFTGIKSQGDGPADNQNASHSQKLNQKMLE